MPIFDEIDRKPDHGAEYGEGRFAYLNRSGRPAMAIVRAKLEEWAENYPKPHRATLIGRIRSKDDVAHDSALFELMLHEALVRSGAVIEEIEPPLAHTDRSPDFLVRLPDGRRLYVEATISTGSSDAERRAERRRDAAIAAVDSIKSPDFFLEASFDGAPSEPVRLRKLRDDVTSWLSGLDYQNLKASWVAEPMADSRPAWKADLFGMKVVLRPIPRTNRVAGGRAIGVQMGGGWSRTPGAALRQSMEKKASRYGELELPYMIAVNGMDRSGDEYDVLAALLGTEVVRFRVGEGAEPATTDRTWDGLWISPDRGPRNVGVSAVLVFDGLAAWTQNQRGLIVFNPWATRTLEGVPLDVDRLRPEGDSFHRAEGQTYGQIVGLPHDWLEVD